MWGGAAWGGGGEGERTQSTGSVLFRHGFLSAKCLHYAGTQTFAAVEFNFSAFSSGSK